MKRVWASSAMGELKGWGTNKLTREETNRKADIFTSQGAVIQYAWSHNRILLCGRVVTGFCKLSRNIILGTLNQKGNSKYLAMLYQSLLHCFQVCRRQPPRSGGTSHATERTCIHLSIYDTFGHLAAQRRSRRSMSRVNPVNG